MAITLITDSTCDIDPVVLKEKGILFASLKVLFKDAEYVDKVDITNEQFYNKMRNDSVLPTTSQVNPGEFFTLFSEERSKGNEVLGVFISSELSGTYNSATIAKEMAGTEGIHLVDSRSTSFGLGLLVHLAHKWIGEGKNVTEITEMLQERIKKSQLYGMLDTLDNLKKGGRLSSGSAMIGKMLNLKPIIQVDNGLVNVANKVRGSKKGMLWMIEQLVSEYPEGEVDEIALAYANDVEKLNVFKEMVTSAIRVKNIYESEIGSVVGTHTGEGAVGIVFYRK